VLHLANQIKVLDDSYKLQPSGAEGIAANPGQPSKRRAASPYFGEMLELGELSLELHRECGRVVRSRASGSWSLSADHPPKHLGEAAIAGGMAALLGLASSGERRSGCRGRAESARRRHDSRERFAGTRTRSRGGHAAGGVQLMLFHLLVSAAPQISVLNVTRYITFRTAAASMTALAISLVLGPW
jgi:hypothetical protein